MKTIKTPGVYIDEKNVFEKDIIEVATAVPAFIGYTEKAEIGSESLLNKPTRITSIEEYMQFFGGAPKYQFYLLESVKTEINESISKSDFTVKGKHYILKQNGEKHNLFNSMRLFFQNGGGPCYIVSVGNYNDAIDIEKLMVNGITPLLKEEEPTIVVVPEAIHLNRESCMALQQALLEHCGKMQSRVAILDIYDGYKERSHPDGDVIDNFRNSIGVNYLSYGTAYYPWLHTTIVEDSELGISNFANESLSVLKDLIMAELNMPEEEEDDETLKTAELSALLAHIPNINLEHYNGPSLEEINEALVVASSTYSDCITDIKEQLNLLAPGAAMAGIYTSVDNNRGVWKAPANVPLNSVSCPAVTISQAEQEDLNVPLDGKSINAIRQFIGEGVLVWGARTLDGNSQDWRYVNVRRTFVMLEQSIKRAVKSFAFEPNNENTWTKIRAMIGRFLNSQWKKGGLAGFIPTDAYAVTVGLGSTMTEVDILDGILRISVFVAIVRPAEFIVITFEQQMLES